MKRPDIVLNELAQLYEFRKEIVKFRFKARRKSDKKLHPTADRQRLTHFKSPAMPEDSD